MYINKRIYILFSIQINYYKFLYKIDARKIRVKTGSQNFATILINHTCSLIHLIRHYCQKQRDPVLRQGLVEDTHTSLFISLTQQSTFISFAECRKLFSGRREINQASHS